MPGELQPVWQLELGEVNVEEQAAITQSLRLAGRTTEMPVHQEQDTHFTFNPATQQWEANGPVDKWTVDVGLDARPPNPIPPPYQVTSILEPHPTHTGWFTRLPMIIQSLIHRRGVVLRTLLFLSFNLVVFLLQTAPKRLMSKHSFYFPHCA